MGNIYKFPNGELLHDDDEGLRILREKKYLSKTARVINNVQEKLEWLFHPVTINDRDTGEKNVRKKFNKKNREHSKLLRKIRIALYKKTKKTPGEKTIHGDQKSSVVEKFLEKTGIG